MSIQIGHATGGLLNGGHLSDEQWAAALSESASDGGLNRAIEQHLQNCAQCRNERQNLQLLLGQMRSQVKTTANRPAAFWNWQLQTTLQRIRFGPVRGGLMPALAGTLALLSVALLLLLQRPATSSAPDSHLRAAAAAPAANPGPSHGLPAMDAPSAPTVTGSAPVVIPAASLAMASTANDAILMAEIERTLQAPPAALQPAALLAQELLSAQITPTSATDSTSSASSQGEVR
jgi:hypothetical protein